MTTSGIDGSFSLEAPVGKPSSSLPT